ncbi:sodium- and chloride-dependent taurine transporter [Lingula anatina]|uniref:Transporter n=1 Tax=Lingula anatina TaxID=7574 RepID=A0A1S3HJP5_LINAN|nr:sodium- and chloride-dependent taurine transporter [Lingula anatina]XP_013385677.1 sodium- and chloride-dependent taurine transporter [Lingula anatina]XP_013385678.1 sodium- and chloride-dependent taurine transporter [Lingula anatina]|eukprot:XP_013385676.1 sodium- and chloride-dependent taurine transporter [Lingula anatina]
MERLRKYIYRKMDRQTPDQEKQAEAALDEKKNGVSPVVNGDVLSQGTVSSDSTQDEGTKLKKRETWTNKIDFLLACIGFSVGLGNVWRFPYLCYKNGGGAFLIPYFTCVILGGIPVFFLEVALGQFMSQGGIGVWKLVPLFQGIGYAATVIVFSLNVYYNVILTWAFYYFFASFTSVLPWATCGNAWNTIHCRMHYDVTNSTNATLNASQSVGNDTMFSNKTKGVDSVTEYWERKVLQISTGINAMGTIKWDLALCLLLAWVVVYFCIWKGVKSSGKVMYFTATSPYIFMTVLLIRGATLDGAVDGIKYYLLPDFTKIGELQVWVDAGTQIFFSYSIGLGALTALGSYNKFHHNSYRDSIIFACTNSGTSLLAGLVIFSVLGFMAKEQGTNVGKVAEYGPGLAFIAYPKALAQMPLAPLWSVLFFLMIILLGLDSQFVGVEGFITAIVDQYPHYLRKGHNREIFTGLTCLVSFFIGLSMVTEGGMYVFQLFDFYSGSRIILVVALFECLAISYCYGINRFHDNLEMMYGFRVNPAIKVMWMGVCPAFVTAIFIMSGVTYSELTYNRVYQYPKWAIAIGWTMASVAALMIPLLMIIQIATTPGTLKERIVKLLRPRLKRHQLRPEDDPDDLCTEDAEFYYDPSAATPETALTDSSNSASSGDCEKQEPNGDLKKDGSMNGSRQSMTFYESSF